MQSAVRLSAGAARNIGANQAKGRYLAFLDADVSLAQDWLQNLLRRFGSDLNIRVASAAVAIGNPESIWSRILHWIEFSQFVPGTPSGHKAHLSSSNLVIERERFLKAGGFDESFVMAEDLLLSRAFPGALFFEGTTHINHFYRSRWNEVASHLRKLGFWSGRLRRLTEARGSWLKQIPLASFALPPIRTTLIIWRIWKVDRSEGTRALLHAPMILRALLHWALGFYKGLTTDH
jgi:glycosyltransferase involved in cell wall biosynthesis